MLQIVRAGTERSSKLQAPTTPPKIPGQSRGCRGNLQIPSSLRSQNRSSLSCPAYGLDQDSVTEIPFQSPIESVSDSPVVCYFPFFLISVWFRRSTAGGSTWACFMLSWISGSCHHQTAELCLLRRLENKARNYRAKRVTSVMDILHAARIPAKLARGKCTSSNLISPSRQGWWMGSA